MIEVKGVAVPRKVIAAFSFCEHCEMMDVDSVNYYAGGEIFMNTLKCTKMDICQNAVKLMLQLTPQEALQEQRRIARSMIIEKQNGSAKE